MPMDQHDVPRAAAAEPVKMGPQAADAQAEDSPRPAVAWEGYSLDTLAVVLDFQGSLPADW
jgi:hypothetical protein